MPKKLAFLPGLAGSFGALLVGWLVVMGAGCISQITFFYFITAENYSIIFKLAPLPDYLD